ncbi:AAA family ATPase [Streptococcus suis]
MLLINKFRINNLNGNYDVDLKFDKDRTIFIGENGIGKTTILSILYYLLDLNYKELLRFKFKSLELSLEGEEMFEISRQNISEEVEREERGRDRFHPRLKFEVDEYIDEIKDNAELFNELEDVLKDRMDPYNSESTQFREVMNILRNNDIGLRSNSIRFREEVYARLVHMINPPAYKILIDEIEKIKKKYKLLYFPTYRRIEENLAQLALSSKEERISVKSSGELIHFGMEDVKQKIDNLLNKISKDTNESYNRMTGGLLNTFASGNISSSVERFDREKVDIALSRLGNKITPDSKKKILGKIDDDTLKDDMYLNYLVSSILENYQQLEEIDKKIHNFIKRVNKYLFNKQFVYDAEELKLDIKRTDLDGNIKTHKNFWGDTVDDVIDLGKLSSGEKQLISTFSKIFLEDEKETVILFDEPELSLSVPWQREFIYDISQEKNCKFLFVVTHSPFIYEKLLKNAKEMDKYIVESKEIDFEDTNFDDYRFYNGGSRG